MSSIFLSHSHSVKPFARRIAKDLKDFGVRVWIDEAEIKVGDSLIEKIRAGIDEMEYVGVILSAKSVSSEWVKKEVDLAMNEEIEGQRVKVLPLLVEDCELPGFLKGKLYADFRKPESYQDEFTKLCERIGIKKLHLRDFPINDLSHGEINRILEINSFFCNPRALNGGQIKLLEDSMGMPFMEGYYQLEELQTIVYNLKGSGILHNYELSKDGKIVVDRTLGLIWQQSGSEYCNYEQAQAYIYQLNNQRFCNYNDWRLPTVDEAMSLMEPIPHKTEKFLWDVYIDPIFDLKIGGIWTIDKANTFNPWVVKFAGGVCDYAPRYVNWWVRAVKS